MALWCNGVDLTAGTETLVHSWEDHGFSFTGEDRWKKPNLILLHFSHEEETARQFFTRMKKQRKSAHLYIDHSGQVFQFADLWATRCRHSTVASERSIGIFIQNRGTRKALKKFPRGSMVMTLNNQEHTVLTTTSGQLDALEEVLSLITQSIVIPFDLPSENEDVMLKRIEHGRENLFSGIAGGVHFNKNSIDPGEQILRELWEYSENLKAEDEFSDD